MQVTYYVEDGYAGSRPKYCSIDEEMLAELETEAEKRQYIEDCIEEHFRENVSWACDIVSILNKLKKPS